MTTDSITFEVVHSYVNPSYDCVCSKCGVQFSLHIRTPRLNDNAPRTCPLCESPLTVCNEHYINMDIFDYIAQDFKLDRATVEGIYDLWHPESGDPLTFVAFLKQAVEGKVV